MARHSFAKAAPGSLDSLPRTFTAFDPPAGFERVKYRLDITGMPNGVVELSSKATGPWREKEFVLPRAPGVTSRTVYIRDGKADRLPGPSSSAALWLCGDRDAGRLFKSFFAGAMTLGMIADWIEDDIADRVKDVREHWLAQHRLHADQVYHFLTLMRCYRDKRKAKPKAHGEVGR